MALTLTNFSKQPVTPNYQSAPLNSVNNQNKPEETPKKESTVSKGTVAAATAGLAALAAVGIYIATKGKVKTTPAEIKPAVNNEGLNQEIMQLKSKIRSDYIERRSKAMEDFTLHKNCFTNNAIRSSKAKNEAVALVNRQIEQNQPVVDGFRQNVRTKLAELQKDNDWIDCRKAQKRIDKAFWSKNDQREVSKMRLINGVIDAKLNGSSPYLDAIGMGVDDAMKIIRDPKIDNGMVREMIQKPKNLNCEQISFINRTFGNTKGQVSLSRINGFQGYNSALNALKEAKGGLERVNQAWSEKHTLLKQLAQETRQSEDVKKLRELTAQLKAKE